MKPIVAIVNSSSFGNVFKEHLVELEEVVEIRRVDVPADINAGALADKLQGCHGIIASVTPQFPAEAIAALPELVILARHGIGSNNVDHHAATEHGVVVTRVEGIVEQAAVAELAVALMLTVGRMIPESAKAASDGRWADRAQFVGLELTECKVGIIGLGNIGSRVAQILNSGFRSDVMAYDPDVSDEAIRKTGARPASLDEIFSTSKVISLQCSLNEGNYHLINKETLDKVTNGVVLINTARGELVDDTALIAALSTGKVAYYAADVVEGEPIGADHPLLQEGNVLVVPHIGGYTTESLRGMGETMVRNIKEALVESKIPENLVNTDIHDKGLKAWR